MSERETELARYERHKSPRDVAKYMRDEGKEVGREYRTHGNVWDAPNELLQVGLLHLVIDRLEAIEKAIGEKPRDTMAGQAAWMFRFHDRAVKAIADHKHQCERISRFCDPALLRSDARLWWDIHDLSEEYREAFADGEWTATYGRGKYYRHKRLGAILKKIKRLKTVKTIDDIENLNGIGKATAKKIREKMSR